MDKQRFMVEYVDYKNKFGQVIKMTWMLAWRIGIWFLIYNNDIDPYPYLIGGSFILSFILVYVLQISIPIWPVLRLLLYPLTRLINYDTLPLLYILKRDKDLDFLPKSIATNPKGWGYNNRIKRHRYIEEQSKNKGTFGPYSETALSKIPRPNHKVYPLMTGTPGVGLTSSGFDDKNIYAGQKGETLFSKALAATGILNKTASFWSLYMPDRALNKLDETDIDCVLVTGDTVFCIDLKLYKQGDLTYYNYGKELFAIDNQTGDQVGPTKKMSSQMERVQQNMSLAFGHRRKVKVKSYVVLMPTTRGMGIVDCKWPGDIPAVDLDTMIDILQKETNRKPYDPAKDHRKMETYKLAKLVKQ